MSSEGIALRGNWTRFKGKAAGHVRSNRSYANYPSYAALLAIAVWLFGHYPAFSTIGFQFASPGLLLLACTMVACGSVLAFNLGLVGAWRSRRVDVALSIFAMALVCWV